MRRSVLALVVLFAFPASAQRARPWAERGDVALVVGVSGVSLGDIRPAFGGIGARYRVADRTVVGASLGFGYATRDTDDSVDSQTDQSLRLALWNENHVGRRSALVSPFLGAGVVLGLGQSRSDREVPSCTPALCPGPMTVETYKVSRASIGAGALLGAEVRVARGVTLGAAYTLGVEVARDTQEIPTQPFPRNDRVTSVRVGTGLTDLNLSVYF